MRYEVAGELAAWVDMIVVRKNTAAVHFLVFPEQKIPCGIGLCAQLIKIVGHVLDHVLPLVETEDTTFDMLQLLNREDHVVTADDVDEPFSGHMFD